MSHCYTEAKQQFANHTQKQPPGSEAAYGDLTAELQRRVLEMWAKLHAEISENRDFDLRRQIGITVRDETQIAKACHLRTSDNSQTDAVE